MKIQTFSIVAGTKICNARCPFCVSKMTPNDGLEDQPIVLNIRNFKKACQFAHINNVSTVMITGKGEPLLYPDQITEYLEYLEPYTFPFIEIQTNGILIEKFQTKYLPYLKKRYELGVTTFSISIVHYQKEKNKEIYSPTGEYMQLENLIKILHDMGFVVRLACIMVAGYIDNLEEVLKLIAFAKAHAVEQVTLRPVNKSTQSEDKEVEKWTKDHLLAKEQQEEIENHIKTHGAPLMSLCHGSKIYDFEGQNICLTNSLTLDAATEDLRQLIFFPDGKLKYDWQYQGATLL